MKSTPNIVKLGLLVTLMSCGTTHQDPLGDTTPDAGLTLDLSQPPANPTEWVEHYVLGVIGPNELCEGLQDFEATPSLIEAAQEPGIHILTGEHVTDTDLVIESDSTVILLAGTTLRLGDAVTLDIQGRLIALGKDTTPVVITSLGTYKAVALNGGVSTFHHTSFSHGIDLVTAQDTGKTLLLFEYCSFEHWQDVALRFVGADGLLVKNSTFGLESENESHGECINGKKSAVEIRHCTFGPMTDYADVMDLEDCQGSHLPHIIGNTLMGGQDDGIDLDDCNALVVGNLIQDFWPPDPANPYKGVNGGGITGHNSSPVLINNVVLGCFHGIGFKNGARPVLIHNTIIDGNIGVTLYRTNSSYDDPHGTLLNNIVVGNRAHDSGANQDLVLHGRWWPSYDSSAGNQASVDLTHNLFGMDYGGINNQQGQIDFDWVTRLPIPKAGSLADSKGHLLPVEVPGFGEEDLIEHLTHDYLGANRSKQAPTLGALEVSP